MLRSSNLEPPQQHREVCSSSLQQKVEEAGPRELGPTEGGYGCIAEIASIYLHAGAPLREILPQDDGSPILSEPGTPNHDQDLRVPLFTTPAISG